MLLLLFWKYPNDSARDSHRWLDVCIPVISYGQRPTGFSLGFGDDGRTGCLVSSHGIVVATINPLAVSAMATRVALVGLSMQRNRQFSHTEV